MGPEMLSGQNHSDGIAYKIGLWPVCVVAISEALLQANSVLITFKCIISFSVYREKQVLMLRKKMNSLLKAFSEPGKDKGEMWEQTWSSGNQAVKCTALLYSLFNVPLSEKVQSHRMYSYKNISLDRCVPLLPKGLTCKTSLQEVVQAGMWMI